MAGKAGKKTDFKEAGVLILQYNSPEGGDDMKEMNLALIGFGNVGREFARILVEREKEWAEKFSLKCKVVAISTLRRGTLLNEAGINLERALAGLETGEIFSPDDPDYSTIDPAGIAALEFVDTFIEITTLNIESGRPAADHIRAALSSGRNVITANKGPIAFCYRELKELAAEKEVHFLFEGTVMDCAPVFNLARETLPGCRITGFSGILNSTTNYLLGEIAAGRSFESALQTARDMGWTEADPSMDLEGWDAAVKTAALLNVLMDADISPHHIERKGIGGINRQSTDAAVKEGKVIKLLCEGHLKEGSIFGRVSPQAIPSTHPLAHVSGTSSALTLETDFAGRITVVIEEPKIRQTAYALVSDLLTIVKNSG
jgi:homoserine dehydrogenase